jgi:hypothetical protein
VSRFLSYINFSLDRAVHEMWARRAIETVVSLGPAVGRAKAPATGVTGFMHRRLGWYAVRVLYVFAASAVMLNFSATELQACHTIKNKEARAKCLALKNTKSRSETASPKSKNRPMTAPGKNVQAGKKRAGFASSAKYLKDQLGKQALALGAWGSAHQRHKFIFKPSRRAKSNPALLKLEKKYWNDLVRKYKSRGPSVLGKTFAAKLKAKSVKKANGGSQVVIIARKSGDTSTNSPSVTGGGSSPIIKGKVNTSVSTTKKDASITDLTPVTPADRFAKVGDDVSTSAVPYRSPLPGVTGDVASAAGGYRAVRDLIGPYYDPSGEYGAVGIVAFTTMPQPGDARDIAICLAFKGNLILSADAIRTGFPPQRQIATLWPVKGAREIKVSQPDWPCETLIKSYDLPQSLKALDDAIRAKRLGADEDLKRLRGPLLIAWAPSITRGQPQSVAFLLDLSLTETQQQINDLFRFWRSEVEQSPALWSNGFTLSKFRLQLRHWVDGYGEKILAAIK